MMAAKEPKNNTTFCFVPQNANPLFFIWADFKSPKPTAAKLINGNG